MSVMLLLAVLYFSGCLPQVVWGEEEEDGMYKLIACSSTHIASYNM